MSSRPTVAGVSRSVLSRVSTVLPFAGGQAHRDLADRLREALGPRDRARPRPVPRSRAGGLLGASPLRPGPDTVSPLPYRPEKIQPPPTAADGQRKSSMAAVAPRETAAAVTPIATWPTLVAILAASLGGTCPSTACSFPAVASTATCSSAGPIPWTSCSPGGTISS